MVRSFPLHAAGFFLQNESLVNILPTVMLLIRQQTKTTLRTQVIILTLDLQL